MTHLPLFRFIMSKSANGELEKLLKKIYKGIDKIFELNMLLLSPDQYEQRFKEFKSVWLNK